VDLRDKVGSNLQPVHVPFDRPHFLAASLLSGLCICLGITGSPETIDVLIDELGLASDGTARSEAATTQPAGTCL
ncbi:hypothetical protein BU17DRAFT_58579, partial [Hysterangium stoloniferum]